MAFSAPDVLHALNFKLAESVIDYVRYQVCPSSSTCYLNHFCAMFLHTLNLTLNPIRLETVWAIATAEPGAAFSGESKSSRMIEIPVTFLCHQCVRLHEEVLDMKLPKACTFGGQWRPDNRPVITFVINTRTKNGHCFLYTVRFQSSSAPILGCPVSMQADSGAQAVQIFDSWASHLSPQDFDVFAGPYIKQIIDTVKQTHPDLPIILYISGKLCLPGPTLA